MVWNTLKVDSCSVGVKNSPFFSGNLQFIIEHTKVLSNCSYPQPGDYSLRAATVNLRHVLITSFFLGLVFLTPVLLLISQRAFLTSSMPVICPYNLLGSVSVNKQYTSWDVYSWSVPKSLSPGRNKDCSVTRTSRPSDHRTTSPIFLSSAFFLSHPTLQNFWVVYVPPHSI